MILCLLIRLCMSPPVSAVTLQSPGQNKTRKKQVAMIAQKVIDANHTHKQWCAFVTTPQF
jgi:hypothetical protein